MSFYKDQIQKYFIILVLLTLCFSPVSANVKNDHSKKFGYSTRYGVVTPTQVYSLIESYESLFLYYINNHNRNLSAKIKAMKINPETKKTPEDVFVKVHQLSDLLDKMSNRLQLPPTSRINREKKNAIPAEVFLQSGNILDAFVKIMNKIESGQAWGDFYRANDYKVSKTPTDVFALADLMVRRFEVVLH